MQRTLSAAIVVVSIGCSGARTPTRVSPAARLDDLIAADMAFASSSERTDVVSALTSMFAPNVVFLSAGRVARGADSAAALLRANPDNGRSHMSWRPIGAHIAASGDVGYTYGYFRVDRAGGGVVAGKYLAFWTRTRDGWRLSAYKRSIGPRADTVTAGPVQRTISTTALRDDSTHRAALLHEAEARFSELAQSVSLGEAFRRTAAPDAVHTGSPNDASFRFGPDAIKAGFDAGGPPLARITWASDEERVSRTGDIGLTTGWITIQRGPNDAPVRVPYLTIWKAASDGTWRFAAE